MPHNNEIEPGEIRPRIGDVEPVTMRCEYQLPFERGSMQTACGSTIQATNGDKNWRVVIEGIMTIPQLAQINQLRGENPVTVLTAEFGRMQIAFDNLTVTRADEQKVGQIEGEYGPLLSFQLQAKQDDEESGIEEIVDYTD